MSSALQSPFNPDITPELLEEVEEAFGKFKVRFLMPLVDLDLHHLLPQVTKQGRELESPVRAEKAVLRETLANRDGDVCAYCGASFVGPTRTIDHILPYRMVRAWPLADLVLACDPCNSGKADRIPAVLVPLLLSLVHQIVKLNAAPVERSLVLAGGAR